MKPTEPIDLTGTSLKLSIKKVFLDFYRREIAAIC